jgi:hypothetical protein
MADTIRITFANLDEAKQVLVALHTKVQEVTNDPEFSNINAYWSIGPAKNALHDAFQNLRQCSTDFGELVNATITMLMQAGMAFNDADGNAVQLINGTLRYPGNSAGIVVGASGTGGDTGIYSADNKTSSTIGINATAAVGDTGIYSEDNRIHSSVTMNAQVNYTEISQIFISRADWLTAIQISDVFADIRDPGLGISIVPPPHELRINAALQSVPTPVIVLAGF